MGGRAPRGVRPAASLAGGIQRRALEAGLVGSRRRGEEACSNPAGVVGEGTEVGSRGRVGRAAACMGVADPPMAWVGHSVSHAAGVLEGRTGVALFDVLELGCLQAAGFRTVESGAGVALGEWPPFDGSERSTVGCYVP